ncbi:MAG: methyltransferase domain-containing protein [Desulfobacteraceae bacterium]|nr:methyltransferase domain-containing protein [Desulfobacteraceae bacterium]
MNKKEFSFILPKVEKADQGKEKIIVTYKGKTKELITHDYPEIYKIPGLYENLFYDTLDCQSPKVVCGLLENALNESDDDPSDIVALDVGAGNGMVGEELVDMGVDKVLGIDIIKEAAEAAKRDRPGVYDAYYVEDLTKLPGKVEEKINQENPNCLSIVAALGFDDIPADAFAKSYNLIADEGWIAFNIKDEFLQENHPSGFSEMIGQLVEEDIMEIVDKKKYQHRLCLDGTPLNYYAVVAKKQGPISSRIMQQYQ